MSDPDFIPLPEDAGYIAVDGGRIWYRIVGRGHFHTGRTPLVVIHGGPGASHDYLLLLTDLASDRPVIHYDQLDCGYGTRTGDPANWTVARFVAEIDTLRDALGLSRVSLLGSSCGGTWAAEYAVRRPAGLAALVLASPFLQGECFVADAQRLRAALPAATLETFQRHEAAGTTDSEEYHDAELEWFRRHIFRMPDWPAYLNRTMDVFNGELYNYMWGSAESNPSGLLKDYDITPRLAEITAPTLYTCGEYDEMTPESCAEFSQLTPNSKLRVFEDASHSPHAEQREKYMGVLREFLAQSE